MRKTLVFITIGLLGIIGSTTAQDGCIDPILIDPSCLALWEVKPPPSSAGSRPGSVGFDTFETYDDHRMAMAFALVGLRVAGVKIAGPSCVNKTFPTFFDALEQLR